MALLRIKNLTSINLYWKYSSEFDPFKCLVYSGLAMPLNLGKLYYVPKIHKLLRAVPSRPHLLKRFLNIKTTFLNPLCKMAAPILKTLVNVGKKLKILLKLQRSYPGCSGCCWTLFRSSREYLEKDSVREIHLRYQLRVRYSW